MDLRAKFEKGKENRTFQRIDSTYSANIFVGYDDDGRMALVIAENSTFKQIQSSKLIEVKLKKRDDGRLALSFCLLDTSYESLFLIFCRDIIAVCEKAGNDLAISSAMIRWKYWKEMFGKKKQTTLNKQEVKGLIGELLILKEYFFTKWGEEKAIRSWMGPLLGHKDFEIDNTWFEIKSVNENAIQVRISSLEQLESEEKGHLVVMRLEETSTVVNNSININELVTDIISLIADVENLNIFQTKLDNIGYVYDEEYDSWNFLYKSRQSYYVDESFPRIRRKNIEGSIGNVEYTILLDGIRNYKEDLV